jgi:Zn-finger nucleic acid-binding protein
MMEDVFKMGENLANNLGVPYEETTWFGEEGTCPTCHLNMVHLDGTDTVTCAVCGSKGKLTLDGGELKVTFSPEEIARARNTLVGLNEHHAEIGEMMKICIPIIMEKKDFLDAKKKEIAAYKPVWK